LSASSSAVVGFGAACSELDVEVAVCAVWTLLHAGGCDHEPLASFEVRLSSPLQLLAQLRLHYDGFPHRDEFVVEPRMEVEDDLALAG
jgi:hypothetical protein